MSFKTTWETNGILWEFEGIVPFSDLRKVNVQFYEDPRSDHAYYQIFDGRNIARLLLTDSELTELAVLDVGASISLPDLKIAMVITDKNVIALAQKFIDIVLQLNSNWDFKFFADIKEARSWIAANN
ncbi:hypothetical protein A9Q79_02300 [Methylophaga sp. 42_25_T18]|nr:hypothetical protein A9Q79_02300 [Methylophaga sp. 42_25_T18]OUR87174.1 hypothetical protein A9Q92_04745 [Methylophaga sp. 42_8_T64]